MKRLGKSSTNKVISGVCGGVAEYFNIDPTIVRLVWAAFTLFGGSGLILYILCAILMPYGTYDDTPPHDYVDRSDRSN